MNIALIGYRGSGKSSVAQALAAQLGWSWVDADAVLEKKAGRSIRQIFAVEGEQAFRALESQVLAQLVASRQQVLALGGGVVLSADNRTLLADQIVVWLQAPAEILHQRIHGDPTTVERRPNLTSSGGLEEIRQLLKQRGPLYQECADFIVQTDAKSPEQIAAEIVSLVSASTDLDVAGKPA